MVTPRAKSCSNRRAEDHRVGDVVDGELVEAEKIDTGCQIVCRRCDRIEVVRSAVLCNAPMRGDTVLHLEHERKEVDAALAGRRGRLEEEVHQKRLAAPDRAKDIETAWLGPAPPSDRSQASAPFRD